jgi:fatty acid synthase
MAAVGLNFKDVEKNLPSSIDIACHNGIESTTISGKAEDVRKYLGELKSQNIFAKEVDCSGFPLHSRYITKMGEKLYEKLKKVIKNPKERSEKWLSTAFPVDQWENEECKLSSAEYHTKNLLNPVLLEEVTKMLPNNAITIEIAPHGLLNSILKQSMTEGIHFRLTDRGSEEGSNVITDALGRYVLTFN